MGWGGGRDGIGGGEGGRERGGSSRRPGKIVLIGYVLRWVSLFPYLGVSWLVSLLVCKLSQLVAWLVKYWTFTPRRTSAIVSR